MKAQPLIAGFTGFIDSQDATDVDVAEKVIPFSVVKRVRRFSDESPGQQQLFGMVIRVAKQTSTWEGIGFLSIELAAVAGVTISLVRALQ